MYEYIPNWFPDFYCVWKVSNGLDDLKAAIYACPNHIDDDIHSDQGYLDTWDNPAGPP